MTGKRYSEALTWLKQAKILALPDKQKEIDEKMAEVQKRHRREACSAWNNRQCPSRSRLHNRRHRNTGARANPYVLVRTAGSGSATRLTTANASACCTPRTAANAARTIYATDPTTGSSTTSRNPVPSTGTDAATADRRKAMDATGLVTVCTGAGDRKNL